MYLRGGMTWPTHVFANGELNAFITYTSSPACLSSYMHKQELYACVVCGSETHDDDTSRSLFRSEKNLFAMKSLDPYCAQTPTDYSYHAQYFLMPLAHLWYYPAVDLWNLLAAEAEPSNPKRGLFSFRGQSLRMPERGQDGRVRSLAPTKNNAYAYETYEKNTRFSLSIYGRSHRTKRTLWCMHDVSLNFALPCTSMTRMKNTTNTRIPLTMHAFPCARCLTRTVTREAHRPYMHTYTQWSKLPEVYVRSRYLSDYAPYMHTRTHTHTHPHTHTHTHDYRTCRYMSDPKTGAECIFADILWGRWKARTWDSDRGWTASCSNGVNSHLHRMLQQGGRSKACPHLQLYLCLYPQFRMRAPKAREQGRIWREACWRLGGMRLRSHPQGEMRMIFWILFFSLWSFCPFFVVFCVSGHCVVRM